MREAGFSSPQVKTYLEEDLAHNSTPPPHPPPLSQLFPRSASASALRLTPSSNLSFSQHYYYPYPMVPTNPSLNPSLNPSFNPSLNPSSPFINPRIGHPQAQNPAMAALDAGGGDNVRRIVEVLLRRKKKCPILVGEPGDLLHAVIRELILAIESLSSSSSSPSPFSPSSAAPLRGTTFLLPQLSPLFLLSATKPDLDARFRKLNRDVEMSMPNGAIVHIGDLQWLLDTTPRASLTPTPTPPYKETFCPVEYAAFELGQIYTRHSCSGRVWFIGTASFQTYLRFQALHASVENLWELQPVPITSSTSKLRSNTMESKGTLLDHSLILRTLPFNHSVSEAKPDLLNGFRQQRSELSLLNDENVTITNARSESPHSCSSSLETCNEREEGQASAKALPPWLQRAVPSDMAQLGGCYAKKVAEATRSADEAPFPKPSGQQATTINFLAVMDETAVKTDLSIGRPLPAGFLSRCDEVNLDKEEEEEDAVRRERVMKNISSHYSPTGDGAGAGHSLISRPTAQPQAPLANNYYHPSVSSTVPARLMDPNAIKQLYRMLSEKVGWQEEAISCIVNTVAQCRSGLASRRSPSMTGSLRSDTWLLFLGPDRAGKRKMAKALAEAVFSSDKAVSVISLSSGQRHNCSKGFEPATTTRSKLPIDCFVEAIRQNPLSVVLLEDVDEADTVLKANLRFAFESGRLQDSYRREVSLSNSIIVMASSLGRGGGGGEHREGTALLCIKEEGLSVVPGFGMRLVEANGEKLRSVLFMTRSGSVSIVSSSWSSSSAPDPSPPAKRRRKADWNTTEDNEEAAGNGSTDCHRSKRKSTGEHLSLDLNLALDNGFKAGEDGDGDGDGDGEEEVEVHITSLKDFAKDIPKDFLEMADAVAVFQAVDFNGIEAAAIEALEKSFFNKLGSYVGALEVDVKVVEQMMAALWWGSLDQRALEKWLFDAAAQCSLSSGLLPRHEAAAVVAKLLPVVAAESSGPDVFCFPHNTPFDNNSSVTEEEIPFN